jgi:hypothetical protein
MLVTLPVAQKSSDNILSVTKPSSSTCIGWLRILSHNFFILPVSFLQYHKKNKAIIPEVIDAVALANSAILKVSRGTANKFKKHDTKTDAHPINMSFLTELPPSSSMSS